nr:hypothetical protein [Tanacetum cinerariifolium]
MALPDKHQLKFNIHKDAKSLMEAIEKQFGGNKETKKRNKTDLEDQSLDDLFNSLKLYEAKVKSSSTTSPTTQNIAFVSSQNTDSTNESVSVVTSVSVASTKVPVSTLPNVDTLSDAVIYSFFASQSNSPQLDNDDLKQIDADDLEEMDLKCNDWSFQADEEQKNYALMAFISSSSSSSDNENEHVFEEDNIVLKLDVMLKEDALVELRKKFEKAEQERDELKLKLDKFQTSSKNLNVSMPPSPVHDRYQLRVGYHAGPPTYTVTFMPPKPDLVFHVASTVNETVSDSEDESEGEPMPSQKAPSFVQASKHVKTPRPSVKLVEHFSLAENLRKEIPKPRGHRKAWHVVPTTVLIRSRLVPLIAARLATIVVPYVNVTRPRPAKTVVTKLHSPLRRPINHSPSPKPSNFPQKVTTVKALQIHTLTFLFHVPGNPQHDLKDKGVIDSGCSRHMTGNISFLFNFEAINGGYVAFGGNPKGGNVIGKEAVNTACYVQNRVLVTKPHNKTPYELLLGRTPSIGFMRPFGCHVTILNTLDPLDPQNTDVDTTFEVKEPESEVYVSPSSSAKTKKHDDKTKREAKGKSLVDTPVTVVELNSTNSTNTLSAASPSNNVVSLNFEITGKSSFMDPLQYPDVPNMPALEDITYSDDEEDVSAEADFSNLETNIIVSPILTTRFHKDHHVSQIIGDLSLAPLTRSMTRMVKDQGGLRQITNEDFYTCMFACFLSQKNPREYTKISKILIGLKLCKRIFFNSRCKRNKAPLVTQGHTQEEGIEYEEVFAPIARIEAIRQKGHILLVQVYVDDIIFGFTNKELCKAFEKLMKDKFQISLIDELTFFLGLQVKQKDDGIFISQDKYVAKILRKFSLTDEKSASIPIDTEKPLFKDPDGEDVDVHTYRSMIGSLMYLTSSRPDIMFAVYTCARF